MNTTDTIIIGEGFFGLFVGIKIAEKGYNVKIFEMNAKPLFITNLRLIFPEQYTYIKRFLNKLNISYTIIHNNNTTIASIISNLDKMPTSLQKDTLFKDTCNNIFYEKYENLITLCYKILEDFDKYNKMVQNLDILSIINKRKETIQNIKFD